MQERQLIFWNELGIFAGLNESEEDFLRRAQDLEKKRKEGFSHPLFSLFPSWVSISWEAKGLMPWEAGATWIEESEKGEKIASIQIHPRFKRKEKEIIAHELVHAVRMHWNQKWFEEILAFQTSSHFLRRYFGPLFSSPKETKLLLILFLLSWVGSLIDSFFFSDMALKLLIFPFAFLFFCLIRLVFLQNTFQKCLAQLMLLVNERKKALEMALHLTDKEIFFFATSSFDEMKDYIFSRNDLRWRQLILAYLMPVWL